MKHKLKILIILLLLNLQSSAIYTMARARSTDRMLFHAALEAMQQFRFDEAEKITTELEHANNDLFCLAKLNLLWWKGIISGPDNPYFEQLRAIVNENIHNAADYSSLTEHETILRIMSGIFLMRIAGIEGNRVSAMKAFRAIEPFLRIVLAAPEQCEEYLLISGIYNFIAGSIKQHFILFRPLFLLLPAVNAELGQEQLNKLRNGDNKALSIEAGYFMYKVESEIKNNTQAAIVSLEQIVTKNPGNIIYRLEYIRLLLKSGSQADFYKAETQQLIESSGLQAYQKAYLQSQLNSLV